MKGILNYYNNNPDNDEEYSAEAWEELIQESPHFATSLSYWLYRNNIDIEKEEYFGRVQKLIRKIITELNVSPYEKNNRYKHIWSIFYRKHHRRFAIENSHTQ